MKDVNTHLPEAAAKLLDVFPDGRLCRFINRHSGTLLDVQPTLDLVNDDVPQVVGNPESAGVQYWIITPYGDGQAIIPRAVPKTGSSQIRYLTPSSIAPDQPVTVSPFPVSWTILPTAGCPHKDKSPLTGFSVPEGLYEEWTCQICWPHFRSGEPRMLDLWAGKMKENTKVGCCCLLRVGWGLADIGV
ncbi:hypothetical protein B0H12DRAFT_152555 [Mycena haematopus]|nr:hypothetical protein B0H12DRAFT_152555 [Mycena haematopus]